MTGATRLRPDVLIDLAGGPSLVGRRDELLLLEEALGDPPAADLGAEWDVARVGRTLRERGLQPAHRRGRKGYGGDLSPRESEVARLAAEGLTNREIAEMLFLSPRTVEGHVATALRKLGVTSRQELAPSTRVGADAQ